QLARDAVVALDGLVGVGIDAQRDRAAAVTGLRQLDPQLLRRVGLGVQAGFEIQARREVQIGVRGAREAVHAAVLAAAVGVDRLAEADVGGLVAADDAACALLGHVRIGARRSSGVAGGICRIPGRTPAVVLAVRDP